ncbi:uncharacterized protein LOC142182673 [Nicotiana tabacum]|uniref:Uncharacterized protein LOC142182673 n=1 Tax=Nicotiana tabacum TaxID=4097 RepID=A0AC58UUQ8_TOBAC
MSSTHNAPIHEDEGLGENSGIGVCIPHINPEEVPNMEPVEISLHNALNMDADTGPARNAHREARAGRQETRGMEEGGVSLQVIFEMLQAQQVVIAQLQSQNRTHNTAEPVNTRRAEPMRPDENGSGTDPTIRKMLEELAKRIETREKKIEENDKNMETCNLRVDQISGAPPILKGLDSKKFVQKIFPQSAAPKPIPKKFRMRDIPKYNGTTDPNEHITTYTCGIKGNYLEDDEIESVLLKKFRETISKDAMIWYHNLPPNSIDSFAMLADSLVKAYVGAIKVAITKSDVFKIKQRENEMLREFVSRFQSERMELPLVFDD